MTQVGVSIISANYMELGKELDQIEQSKSNYLHLDIMDGHFVPNITFGPEMVRQMKQKTTLPLDVHLMIKYPENYIKEFAEAGADIISVHYEACGEKTSEIIDLIHSFGVKAGIVINPDTSAERIKPYLHQVELVLQMTVYPGFGGQKFITTTLDNIRQIANWRDQYNLAYVIEVDGGINEETALLCIEAGVDILVAGSFFIESTDKKALTRSLQHL